MQNKDIEEKNKDIEQKIKAQNEEEKRYWRSRLAPTALELRNNEEREAKTPPPSPVSFRERLIDGLIYRITKLLKQEGLGEQLKIEQGRNDTLRFNFIDKDNSEFAIDIKFKGADTVIDSITMVQSRFSVGATLSQMLKLKKVDMFEDDKRNIVATVDNLDRKRLIMDRAGLSFDIDEKGKLTVTIQNEVKLYKLTAKSSGSVNLELMAPERQSKFEKLLNFLNLGRDGPQL